MNQVWVEAVATISIWLGRGVVMFMLQGTEWVGDGEGIIPIE